MSENNEAFLKGLAELRELALKGSDADPKKFNMLAESLLWDVKSRFALPMTADHMAFIKILATSETGYWKGYGTALTEFLLPLQHSIEQVSSPKQGAHQAPMKLGIETDSPPPNASPEEKDGKEAIFIMD